MTLKKHCKKCKETLYVGALCKEHYKEAFQKNKYGWSFVELG